ncbi:collagen-like protein [Catenulispora rubra]|uniref:collagen-like protein n=1 Tax=Catenulispora rubra TaxID=280293 RepID=UPI0018927CFD|nr:collagen-like protein [Catenulispora rubra]
MTTSAEAGADAASTMGGACHTMLLRLAGRAPDGLLTQARAWLADGEVELLARAVASGVAAAGLTLAPDDLVLLRWVLEVAGLDAAPLDRVVVGEEADTPVEHAFTPAAPEVMERLGAEFGPCLDVSWLGGGRLGSDSADSAGTAGTAGTVGTAGPISPTGSISPAGAVGLAGLAGAVGTAGTVSPAGTVGPAHLAEVVDDRDRAAVAAAAELPGTVALWRAWRQPADGAPWPAPRRVYLLAVADPQSAWATTAELQRRLAAHGEVDPQVEAFATDQFLPPYQRTARSSSALLWTAAPSVPIRLAPVYDKADNDAAPGFAADRPRLADIDRVVVADLLDGGTVVLSTTAYLDDVLSPGRRIPVNFRTDGFWVWNDAAAYYAREHGIAPVAALLDHLRSDRPRTRPDAVALFRATAALTQPEPAQG